MLPVPLPEPLFWAASLAFGLVLGSFANVCIHRLPEGRSVVTPGSHCPHCGAPVRAWQNVPVLSYVSLRGRCAACAAPISPRYPLVEAAHGLLYLGLAAQFGPTPAALVRMLLVSALVVLALIDADHQLLPDVITLPGIAAGWAASLVPGWNVGWLEALLAALGGFLIFAAVGFAWERLRGIEALGRGDWKLAAMLGAFLGWQQLLLVVFLGSLAGTLVGLVGMARYGHGLQQRLPFGTFLGLAAIAVVFVGPALINWYGGLWRF